MLAYIVIIFSSLKYVLIFLATPIGGPTLILGAGVLLHEGLLSLPPLFAAIALGELTQDILWYFLGYRYGDRFVEKGQIFQRLLKNSKISKSLFCGTVSDWYWCKINDGVLPHHFRVVVVGAARMYFGKYIALNLLGELCSPVCLLAIILADFRSMSHKDFASRSWSEE